MGKIKICDVCGNYIHKVSKKELKFVARNFVSKMIEDSLNDGSFLKPLKEMGIDENNFAHHMDIVNIYVEELKLVNKREV